MKGHKRRDLGHDVILFGSDQKIHNIHGVYQCQGRPCPIHNPSWHHMHDWWQWYDAPSKLMFRICPHGRYHIDPDNWVKAFHCNVFCDSSLHDSCCTPPNELTIVDLSNIMLGA